MSVKWLTLACLCTSKMSVISVNCFFKEQKKKTILEFKMFLLCVFLVWLASSSEHMFLAQLALLASVSCPCCLWLCFLSAHSQAVDSPATQPCQTHSHFIRCSILQFTQSFLAAALFDIILTYSQHFPLIVCILVKVLGKDQKVKNIGNVA